jgi:hypothetical protein
MKEKLLWSAVLILGLMLVLAEGQTPARTHPQIGRYQIVATPQDSAFGVQVFRLDTATGNTWMQAIVLEGGAKKPGWAVMPDYSRPK